MLARLCLLLIFNYAASEVAIKGNDIPDKGRMLGVDMVHKRNIIDKDTIINRSFNLERKGRGNSAKPIAKSEQHVKKSENPEKTEADWSYSSIPREAVTHVDQFKKNMTECLKEVQTNDKRPVKRLSPKQESPVNGECLIACVLKRNGVIQDGKVHKDSLLTLVKKFYSKETKLMKKLEKHVDRCIELSKAGRSDDCALAARLNACTNDIMQGNKHKLVVNY